MTDISDGLARDLSHIAESSGVGFELEDVPVAAGATLEEALGGGEDYLLVFTASPGAQVEGAFAGLAPPIAIGTCTADPSRHRLAGRPMEPWGWEHSL